MGGDSLEKMSKHQKIIAFKVVTQDQKSLGLRHNPTILYFPMNKWVKSPTIKEGECHDGGIHVAVRLSAAKQLKKYMLKKHGKKCRIFLVYLGKILFENSYRFKTDKVCCFGEVK